MEETRVVEIIAFDRPCKVVAPQLSAALEQAGYSVHRTFELQAAVPHIHESVCDCHSQRAASYDCQYVVLLVYAATGKPITLVLQGDNAQSWATIVDTPYLTSNSALKASVDRLLREQALA